MPAAPAEDARPVVAATPRFGNLELSEPVWRAIANMGYTEPTPIQEAIVPLLLEGRDAVGRAQTGTGKTAAFGIPMVERLDPDQPFVQAIVLVPTRELCVQVAGDLTEIGRYRELLVVATYGGDPIHRQIALLREGAQIVVGTPGRVIDHLRRGTLRLNGVRFVVLDEADQMLDVGFAEDVERILRSAPKQRQTALFSATIPPFVRRLIHRYLVEPATVDVCGDEPTVAEIDQVYFEVAERDKLQGLCWLLDHELEFEQLLIFRRMQIGVDRLLRDLVRRGYPAEAIHGGMSQNERNRVMGRFRSGELRVLIATNLASRGLDIVGISHVLNYDCPENPDEYVHRIGRTGRAGRAGTAVTFVAEWDFDAFEAVKKHIPTPIRQEKLGIYGGMRRETS